MFTLRPCHQALIDQTCTALKGRRSPLVALPTGGGADRCRALDGWPHRGGHPAGPGRRLRQVTPEEAAAQRAIHQAEQLRKVLWLYKRNRVPRWAVLAVLNRAPRSREEFEQVAKVLQFGRSWASTAFAQQRVQPPSAGGAPARQRRSGQSWLERATEGFTTAT